MGSLRDITIELDDVTIHNGTTTGEDHPTKEGGDDSTANDDDNDEGGDEVEGDGEVKIGLVSHSPASSVSRQKADDDEESFFAYIKKRPYLIPFNLLFLFLYFGIPNLILYAFHPFTRITEIAILLIFGPISIIFSNVGHKFENQRKNLIDSQYLNLDAGPNKANLKKKTVSLKLSTKFLFCVLYIPFCYPAIPGVFRWAQGEPFAGDDIYFQVLFVYNIILGGVYFYFMLYSMGSLQQLVSLVNFLARQKASVRIHDLKDLDDWNDSFLAFQNTLENVSKAIQIYVSAIYVIVVLFTGSTIIVTIQASSILFPEWFQMVMLTSILLGLALYLFWAISTTSQNMDECIFKLQSTQMFLARKQRKLLLKQGRDEAYLAHNHDPPVAKAITYIIKYWGLREKGFIFFGIKIDRKLLYSVMGLLTSVFITVFNKILAHFMSGET